MGPEAKSGSAHDHDHSSPDHSHSHGDGQGGTKGWLRHALSDLFGRHSHDPADSIDSALESSKRGIRALVISFVALMVTAILQAGIVVLTGSVALLADTIHNFGDALTAVPLFIAFKIGRRLPNRRFTYGYRRAEDLAGIIIIVLIFASAVLAGYQSIERLINPRPLSYIGVVFAAGVIGFLGNELVAVYRMRVGRQIGSAALVADGLHARVDGLTSLAVAVGAVGVWLGFERADPIVGLAVTVAILFVLKSAAIQIYHRFMDAVDPELVSRIEQIAAATPGVENVGRVQVRWLGHRLRTDLSVHVAAHLRVDQGHDLAEDVRLALLDEIPHLDEALIHVDPAVGQSRSTSSQVIPPTAPSKGGSTY